MSGRGGYANGYGYPDTSRYDRTDGGYGNSSNLAVNSYGGGRERRPGGYGGFYPETPQQPGLSPSQSPDRRRERPDWDRDHEYSSSRSRTRERDGNPERRLQSSSRDGRPRGDNSRLPDSSREKDPNIPSNNSAGSQAVEGLYMIFLALYPSWVSNTFVLLLTLTHVHHRGSAVYPTRMGSRSLGRMRPSSGSFTINGHEYSGESRSRTRIFGCA